MPTDPPLPDWIGPRRHALGRHIARQRYAAGLTVDDIAETTGLNRKTIMHVESALAVPSLVTLLLYADALGITIAQLLDDGPAADTGADSGGTSP